VSSVTERARAPGRPLRNALRNLSLKGLSLGLERVCRLVVVVAAARVLGQATFGRFVFASTVTALLALGTDLGLGVWTTRTLARSRVDGGRVVGVGLALRGLATLPYGFAVAGVAMVAVRGEARAAVALLGVAALVNAFVDHFGAILRGYERFADEAWLNASRAFLTAAAGLVTLTVGHSLAGLCAALAAASLGSCVYGLVTLVRLHPFPASPTRSPLIGTLVGALRGTVNRAVAKIALRESLPIWFAGLLSLLYFKVDTLFLRSMAGDSELGAYGAAYKFFEGAMILPFVLLSVTFPQLARALENPPAQRRLERQIGLLLLALGLFAGAACLLGAAPLVRVVFGDGFDRAVASLRVLSLGLPFLYLNFGLTHFLLARDMGRVTTWLALMMLALNVALDLALIPRRGGPGAAWATVLSEVALTACCLAALRTRLAPAHMPRSVPAAAKTDQTAA
jgi:O-antigen/teichoic acid export membrane protein